MKRSELLQKIKTKVKSFKYTDFDEIKFRLMKDEHGNLIGDSMLVSARDKHPWIIPTDYGVGIKIKQDEKEYISTKYNPTNNYKRCNIEVTDFRFSGNHHCYGKVTVDNTTWVNTETGTSMYSSGLDKLYPEATSCLHWNICRMLFEEDIINGKGDWTEYEAHYPTERFESFDELLMVAIYTILVRIQGPVKIQQSSYCCDEPDKNLLVRIDENENVTLRSDIKKMIFKE